MSLVPPREAGEKLRPEHEARILDLHDQGVMQEAIAAEIGCHQSTVSRTLADWRDTRGMARKYAESKALEMMKRFVEDASPAEILKMQAKLDVVREDREPGGGNQMVVVLGSGSQLLEPPTIQALVSSRRDDGDLLIS